MTYSAAATIIKNKKPNFTPKLGIILGSGLGVIAEQIEDATVIPYHELPGFPVPTVAGHSGNLHLGNLRGTPVACLQGRAHVYEGNNTHSIKTLIRTLKLLGCEAVLITNASGTVRTSMEPGDVMLINDHINFQFFNPLIGSNEDEFGPRFVSMSNAYDIDLREKMLKIADKHAIKLHQGVYLAISGPCFETPAEIRAYQTLGADAVGMSTIPEVIIARHCNLKVIAISAITNLAAGLTDTPMSHEHTLAGAKLAVDKLAKLVIEFVAQ